VCAKAGCRHLAAAGLALDVTVRHGGGAAGVALAFLAVHLTPGLRSGQAAGRLQRALRKQGGQRVGGRGGGAGDGCAWRRPIATVLQGGQGGG